MAVERHPQPWSKVHWTRDWSWVMYTVNLGTGAVSLCVSSIPYPFRGQHAIGEFDVSVVRLVLLCSIWQSKLTFPFLASFVPLLSRLSIPYPQHPCSFPSVSRLPLILSRADLPPVVPRSKIMAFNMTMSTLRLIRHPKAFRDSFYDEVEG